jgi:predicted aspartyl protease
LRIACIALPAGNAAVYYKVPQFNVPLQINECVVKTKQPIEINDPVVTADSSTCIIPFSRAGNLIVIRAKADTVEGNFILDTGAPGLVLNTTYFRDYAALPSDMENQGGITGLVANADHIAMDSLTFGGIKYSKIEADRINLGHLENSKGIKILGLLGMQLFKRFEMIIDYDKSIIYLHLVTKKDKKDYMSDQLKDTATYVTSAIDIVENKLITFVYVTGKKLSFIVDTGAETNVLDSRLPNSIFENVSIARRVILTGTGSRKVEALSGSVNNIKIGGQDINNLPVIVTNLEKLCISYNRCLDGMLGFDFLSLQKIGFNFVKRKMYIWK